jgi:hypothetical protein
VVATHHRPAPSAHIEGQLPLGDDETGLDPSEGEALEVKVAAAKPWKLRGKTHLSRCEPASLGLLVRRRGAW